MIKGQSIIGKNVLSRADGQKFDSLKDIVVGKDPMRVVALLIDEGGLFGSPTIIPMGDVVSFGKDAIIVTDSKAAAHVDRYPAIKDILDSKDSLIGKKVFTEAGEEVGKVSDIYFDEQSGNVVGIDVTGKLAPAASNTTTAYLGMEDVVSIGPDVVIISSAGASKLAGHNATPGAAQDTGDNIARLGGDGTQKPRD